MTPVYRAVFERGEVRIVGADKNGHEFRIQMDPHAADLLADQLKEAANRRMTGRVTRDTREAFDDTATREPIEHSS